MPCPKWFCSVCLKKLVTLLGRTSNPFATGFMKQTQLCQFVAWPERCFFVIKFHLSHDLCSWKSQAVSQALVILYMYTVTVGLSIVHTFDTELNSSTERNKFHAPLPSFKPWRTRYELVNLGLATIDPHSQKEHTEIHKISKFGVNQASTVI